jgi:cytosine/adenosine deaminase-related metal-dependent hydrolase
MNNRDDSTSRRTFLKSGAAVAALGTAASQALPDGASAQGDADLARLQGARRILLKGGVVLTLDRQVGDFAQADVLIEDGKIREVKPDIAAADAVTVDAANRIVIPGFVDTHNHAYQGLLRNVLTNGLVATDYNRDIQSVLTPVYQATDAYAGVLVTALGMIESGVTTIVDISQVNHTPEHSDAAIRALQEAGIRAVYAYHRGSGPRTRYPQDIKRLKQTYFSSNDQLLTLALTTAFNTQMFALAREVDVQSVLHIVGNDLSNQLLDLGRAGLLRPGDEYIHCLGLNDAAWRLIKDSGGHVSICAVIDMTMGHGMPATQEALDHGLRPSLSSDHGVTISQDFFTVMRTTFSLQRLMLLQRAKKGEQNLPPLLTCREVLEFATIEGARCAQIDGKVGTLTPGKEADIVMLRTDRLDIWPMHNAPGIVVNMMNPSHVDAVFIAGKVKKWRGSLVGVDTARVLRLVAEASEGVIGRAGFKTNLLG